MKISLNYDKLLIIKQTKYLVINRNIISSLNLPKNNIKNTFYSQFSQKTPSNISP